MKKIIILIIFITSYNITSAQKYTDRYIKEANKVALNWLSNISHNNYENAYDLLSGNTKQKFDKETWIASMNKLMNEFGQINSRTVSGNNFQSKAKGLEDGFYVFIEYNSDYENTNNHWESIILKQNDQTKWEILDYSYEFESTD